VDYIAELANDIFKKNARGVMKTIKRLGARFALVASIVTIHHAPNV
jgi:hypothetical protein